eukprot:Sspe_Gene.114959::Locus_101362_Transcript_2_3_Confidence_0.500_Length_577::g.114959::m.114959
MSSCGSSASTKSSPLPVSTRRSSLPSSRPLLSLKRSLDDKFRPMSYVPWVPHPSGSTAPPSPASSAERTPGESLESTPRGTPPEGVRCFPRKYDLDYLTRPFETRPIVMDSWFAVPCPPEVVVPTHTQRRTTDRRTPRPAILHVSNTLPDRSGVEGWYEAKLHRRRSV